MNLIKLITDKVNNFESSGKLEEIIEKHVHKCLEDIIRDSFSWNGEAKNSLKKALSKKLEINVFDANIDKYKKIVSKIVEDRIESTVVNDLKDELESSIDNITGFLDKKSWNLSEIIKEFIESIDKSYDGEMDSLYGECTLIIKESSGGLFKHIYFDKESNKEKYNCENCIHIHNDKMYHCTINKNDFSPFLSSNIYGFELFMFKLYCNNVSIYIDEDDCELEYSREDADY